MKHLTSWCHTKRDDSQWNRLFNISNKGKLFIIQPLALLLSPLLELPLQVLLPLESLLL